MSPAGLAAFCGGLDQDLHGGEGVAQLVGEPGRQLAQGGELLRAEHLAPALLEPMDDGADLLGDPVEHALQAGDVPGGERVSGPTTSLSLPAASRMGTLSWAIERLMPRAIPKPASSPAAAPQTPSRSSPKPIRAGIVWFRALDRSTSSSLASR